MLALQCLAGIVVLDEVQRRPQLFRSESFLPMDKNMFALSSCELTRKIHPLK